MSGLDLADLVHLEQDFYDAGYADGTAHGRVHGLIEGRALGQTKGFELWEEVGFYEGFARVYQAAAQRKHDAHAHAQHTTESRVQVHLRTLLRLVAAFPRCNPAAGDDGTQAGADITEQLRRIQARYRALCAVAGVRPRLRAAATAEAADGVGGLPDASPKESLWSFDGDRPPADDARVRRVDTGF